MLDRYGQKLGSPHNFQCSSPPRTGFKRNSFSSFRVKTRGCKDTGPAHRDNVPINKVSKAKNNSPRE
jgi:hypothetical protein